MKKIFIHGLGQKADAWGKTISYMENGGDILCPDLAAILDGKEADYKNLYAAFSEFCGRMDGKLHLCGLSLGGILALQYALEFPDRVKTLALLGVPHRVPRLLLGVQNMIFRCLPEAFFREMEFGKKGVLALGSSMKDLDFSESARKVRCPVLIICGEKDKASRKSAAYFQENMKNAKVEIIRNTGHIVNEEAPEILAKLLDGYYREKEAEYRE